MTSLDGPDVGWRAARPSAGGDDIVVGVDGSPASVAALRWAAIEAQLHRCRLMALMALDPLELTTDSLLGAGFVDEGAARCALLDVVREELGATAAWGVDVRVVSGGAFQSLHRAASHADLLVVGRRHLPGLRRLAVEPLSARLVGGTPTAVAVVPDGWRRRPDGERPDGTVVGLDATTEPAAAAAWAFDEARQRGPRVHVVAAHSPGDAAGADVLFAEVPRRWRRRSSSVPRHALDRGWCPVVFVPPGRRALGGRGAWDATPRVLRTPAGR